MDVTEAKSRLPARIRRAKADDYDQIAAVWSASGLKTSTSGRDGKTAFRRQLEHFPDLYLVATEGERIIGVVLGSHDHRKGWINRLAVLPEYRRHGMAATLTRSCDAALRALGIEIVSALVDPSNKASCCLFEKLGYLTDVPVRYFRKLSRPEA